MDNPFESPTAALIDTPPPRGARPAQVRLAVALGALGWLALMPGALYVELLLVTQGLVSVPSGAGTLLLALAAPPILVAVWRGHNWARAAYAVCMTLTIMHLAMSRLALLPGSRALHVIATLAVLALQGLVAWLLMCRAAERWFDTPDDSDIRPSRSPP